MPVVTLRHSVPEYFDYDRASPARNEFLNGEIRELGGRSPNYTALFSNLSKSLIERFDKSEFCVCVALPLVKVPESSSYCYCDALVVRGAVTFEPQRPATITNPLVVFEILPECLWSPGPEERIKMYQKVPSIEQGVLISPNTVDVEAFSRKPGTGWQRDRFNRLTDTVPFASLDWSLPLSKLYKDYAPN